MVKMETVLYKSEIYCLAITIEKNQLDTDLRRQKWIKGFIVELQFSPSSMYKLMLYRGDLTTY